MKQILTVLLLLVSVVAYGQSTIERTTNNNHQQITSDWKILDQPAYSIQYPSTWDLDQSGQMGTSFILFSPLESDTDKLKENVNLLIQDLSGLQIDLNDYVKISEGQIKTMITNVVLIESNRIKNDTVEYHEIVYSGDQGMFHLQFEQHYWVIDDKAFVLTFTSEKDKFNHSMKIVETILSSFIIKHL